MRIRNLFVIAICSLVLSACGGAGDTPSGSANPASPSVPAPSCVTSLSPASITFPAPGGNDVVRLTAPSSCSWTVRSNASWITWSRANSGVGNATLSYLVDSNSGSASRTATLTDGSHTVTVAQSGSSFLEVKGNYTFEMRPYPGCSWPVSVFTWPVTVQVSSYSNGNTTGTLIFPSLPSVFWSSLYSPQPKWDIQRAGPLGTIIAPDGIGPGFNGYYAVDMSGYVSAGPPTRASDGRGEILTGEFSLGTGGSFHLSQWNSQWQEIDTGWTYTWDSCGSATWTMRIR